MKSYFYGLLLMLLMPFQAFADDYDIDIEGAHAFIDFRIQHLGFSWMSGRFNTFSGKFNYDENKPADSSVSVTIQTASIDTNHAERDKHLRNDTFLDVKQFPEAHFVSTSFEQNADGSAVLWGEFTFRGITKPLKIDVTHVGHGADPWFGYRRGFVGKTQFKLTDYGIGISTLGKQSNNIYLILSIEGIRK